MRHFLTLFVFCILSDYAMQKLTATLFFIAILSSCSSRESDPVVLVQVGTTLGHTHIISMRFADVEAGWTTFVLEESAGHRHELRLPPEKASLLLMHLPVTADSTETDGHAHPVSIYVADD